MKVSLVFLVLVGFGCALSEKRCTRKGYEEYKVKYGKKYPAGKIDEIHFKRYCASVKMVNQINEEYKKGKISWEAAINSFADLTDEELQNTLGLMKPHKLEPAVNQHKPDNSLNAAGGNKTRTS